MRDSQAVHLSRACTARVRINTSGCFILYLQKIAQLVLQRTVALQRTGCDAGKSRSQGSLREGHRKMHAKQVLHTMARILKVSRKCSNRQSLCHDTHELLKFVTSFQKTQHLGAKRQHQRNNCEGIARDLQ